VESGGVSNSLRPEEVEEGVSLTFILVPAVGNGVGGGGVGIEEETVLEGLEGGEPDVGPGGVLEEGLEDGSVGGTSGSEVVGIQQVVGGGEGNVPFRVVSFIIELVELIEMGEVAGVDSVDLEEVQVVVGVSFAGNGRGEGGVQLEDLREEGSNTGLVGVDEGVGELVVQGDELEHGSSGGVVVAVGGSRLAQSEISPDGIVILGELGLSSGDLRHSIRGELNLGKESSLGKGDNSQD